MIYEQYQAIKRAQPDALLLMQVDDFYRAFGADARNLANALGTSCRRITLDKHHVDTYGVPAVMLATTIQTLLGGGHQVAVAQPLSRKDAAGHAIERVVTDARIVQPD